MAADWREIESHPLNERILVAWAGDKGFEDVVEIAENSSDGTWSFTISMHHPGYPPTPPTHWMPLPISPKKEESNDG